MHRLIAALLGVLVVALGGCPPRQPPIRFEPIPLHAATAIVNRNIDKIKGTMRATGSVDGRYTLEDGRRRNYHVDGTLFRLAPTYFRFDLKKLGERQFLFGSNDEQYWMYNKQDDSYFCGRHGVPADLPPGMPARPDQILDALGLTPIPDRPGWLDHVQVVQRVLDDYQQVLLLAYNETGWLMLEREYWLTRYGPRLIRRVIFRDADGIVEMQSVLNDYKPLAPGGPLVPHIVTAEWPKAEARMRFRVGRWSFVPEVGPDSIQFAAPKECGGP